MTAAKTRHVFLAAAIACLLGGTAQNAFAYDGLMSDGPLQTQETPEGSGYDGLVGWQGTQGATNPYGTAPADDIYGFVKGAGANAQERAETARKAREEEKARRRQEMVDRNIQRAQDLQTKLDAQSELQQRKILEHQNEIMRRMQKQQQGQQQRR